MSRFLKIGIMYLALMFFMDLSSVITGFIPEAIMHRYGQFIIILLPVILIAIVSKINIRERFKFNGFKVSTIFYCVIIFLAVLPISGLLSSITTLIFGENPNGIEVYVNGLQGSLLIRWFMIAITPAICEEMMFRGLLLDKKIGLNMHILAIMNGLMFSMFHVGYDQLLYTFPLGMVFAYVAIITNSIFPAMILHLMNNSLGFIGEVFPTGAEDVVVEQSSASSGLGYLAIFAIIGGIIIFFALKKLVKDYGYDDKVRLNENCTDMETYKIEGKIKTFTPQIIMMIYVVLINVVINFNG